MLMENKRLKALLLEGTENDPNKEEEVEGEVDPETGVVKKVTKKVDPKKATVLDIEAEGPEDQTNN
jgi:hypothetical protein